MDVINPPGMTHIFALLGITSGHATNNIGPGFSFGRGSTVKKEMSVDTSFKQNQVQK